MSEWKITEWAGLHGYPVVLVLTIVTGCIGIPGLWSPTSTSHAAMDAMNAERVALGQKIYASFCAGCHGENLQGQSNWQRRLPLGNFPAPPHDDTGHTWHHPDQWLFEIVKFGGQYHAPPRYRSAMPSYKDTLSDDEIWAVLSFIKSNWSPSAQSEQVRRNQSDP